MIEGDQTKLLEKFSMCFASAKAPHTYRVDRYRKCDEAYNAVLKPLEDTWQSDLHPPYVAQIVELLASNLVDDNPRAKVVPSQPYYADGAALHEALLNQQREIDRYAEKLPLFILQGLIRGISIGKVIWREEWVKNKVRKFEKTAFGAPFEKVEETLTPMAQQPGFVLVDAKNFLWDPSATNLDNATEVFHITYQTLSSMRASGVYENLDQLKGDDAPVGFDDDKRKGRVEVIEWWRKENGEVYLTVIANQRVVIRNECSPFWHGHFPFVVATPIPELFQIEGKSIVEMIADIQAALWEMQNHRIDNTRFMSNAALFVDPSVEQQDFRVFPGAMIHARPDQIQAWQPNTSILGPSVQAEELLKGDLQNLSGAVGYLSGASDSQIDQTTATGISIIQNMASKRIMRMKQQYLYAMKRVGEQQISLNQQLLPKTVAIRIDRGAAGLEWKAASPAELQGQYEYRVEDASESLIRQEKRAEALAKANFLTANYQLAEMAGVKLDIKKVIEDVTEAFDEDPAKYFADTSSQQLPDPALVSGEGGAAGAITAPEASGLMTPMPNFGGAAPAA